MSTEEVKKKPNNNRRRNRRRPNQQKNQTKMNLVAMAIKGIGEKATPKVKRIPSGIETEFPTILQKKTLTLEKKIVIVEVH